MQILIQQEKVLNDVCLTLKLVCIWLADCFLVNSNSGLAEDSHRTEEDTDRLSQQVVFVHASAEYDGLTLSHLVGEVVV